MLTRLGAWLTRARGGGRTIRVRLTLWYVALLTVILLAFSAFLYLNLAHNLHAELDRSLVVEADRITSSADVQDGEPSLNGQFDASGTGIVAALYDATGTRLIDSDAQQAFLDRAAPLARAVPSRATITLADGSTWRVLTTPLVANGRVTGVLQVARSEAGIALALGQLVLLIAIAVPVTLLLAVFGGLFLAGRALDPIDRMTRTAEQMGAEDLGRRLHFRGTDDEIGRLATTFDRMLDRLDGAFRRQRQFTADASHELRTPLALLISQADLALERSRTPAEYRRVMLSVRDDAQRMARLLGDLLTLARADTGQDALAREPLDLGDLVGDVVTALTPLADTHGVTLTRGTAESTTVMGDQTRLTQLFVNLVGNAIKYTPTGGVVSVSIRREGTTAIAEVSDTGVGIAAEHLPHVFERFYRVDSARSNAEGGVGLGLAISRWIAQAHGGHIAVTSRVGHGSTFTVALPRAIRSAPPPDHRSTPVNGRAGPAQRPGRP